jgi:hypothetical protein
MSAAVDDQGTLVSGAGAVSATNKTTGLFLVFFNRDLRSCQAVASTGTTALHTSVQGGTAVANVDSFFDASTNHVEVFTRNNAGSFADIAFMVLVFCPK